MKIHIVMAEFNETDGRDWWSYYLPVVAYTDPAEARRKHEMLTAALSPLTRMKSGDPVRYYLAGTELVS